MTTYNVTLINYSKNFQQTITVPHDEYILGEAAEVKTKDKEQKTKNKGQRTKNKEQRTKDKGQRTKDK